MQRARSSHIHRVRLAASTIFGCGFQQEWFLTQYDRNSLPEFQEQLGAIITPEGKKYPLLPPVLYPNESLDKNTLFMNPALAKVCDLSVQRIVRCAYTYIDTKGYVLWTYLALWQEVTWPHAEWGTMGTPGSDSWYDRPCCDHSKYI